MTNFCPRCNANTEPTDRFCHQCGSRLPVEAGCAFGSSWTVEPPRPAMRNFELFRVKDMSGMSGVGVVADGVEWDDGTVVIHWRGKVRSTTIFDSVAAMISIHGHEGATELSWCDGKAE